MKQFSIFYFDKNQAFTLIELLVVLAIIALLTSLTIGSVFHYRDRARDAGIETSLSQIRSVATIIYTDKSAYDSMCDLGVLNTNEIESLVIINRETKKFNGGADIICQADQRKYCVSSPLASSGDYCVDSTGYAGSNRTNCGSDAVCN